MKPRISIMCSRPYPEVVAVAAAVVAAVLVAAPGAARACGGGDFSADMETTFDPAVLGDKAEEGMFWDPTTTGIGHGACEDCAAHEMQADWGAFLGPGVPWADWSKILLSASLPEIDALIVAMKSDGARPRPHGFERNAVLTATDRRDDLIAALYFVGFARRVEPFAAPPPSSWDGPKERPAPAVDPSALFDSGVKALARAKSPFLRQRYAFQLLRLRFYMRDWPGTVAFLDKNRAALEGPAQSLKWRAQYYVAGALLKMNERPRANLLLARVHAGWPALASVAAQDFQPMQQRDWEGTLALASSVREKVELWRLVGLKLDALAAMEKMTALDPRSPRLALLAVRELNRAEGNQADLAKLERLALRLADRPTTDRPWVFDLVAGHAAALLGDLPTARRRLDRARAAVPGDQAVAEQSAASLALALARTCKAQEPRCEDELAGAIKAMTPGFSRQAVVRERVRSLLADGYLARDRCVEAELLRAGACAQRSVWSDPRFVEAMIARASAPRTAFDRFMLEGAGYNAGGLRDELGLLQFRRGDLEAAQRTFRQKGAGATPLGTDPFVIHIRDCHDCDHATYANAPWTRASFALRIIDLRARAESPGAVGAAAALQLGNGYYNITWFGNARSFFEATHVGADINEAEAWYKRAYQRFPSREDQAQAAFMAAKSELARLLSEQGSNDPDQVAQNLPIPTTWFPIVRTFADTKYYAEILRECGHYRRWARRR
jgi:hypothetical protein